MTTRLLSQRSGRDDRLAKKTAGGSIYNIRGYSAHNEAGTAYLSDIYSTVPLGIGLHIYGSNNNVTADELQGAMVDNYNLYGSVYTLRNNQDKTHFLCSLSGENEFAKGWFLNGDVQLQKGAHDRDVSASLQVKRVW